MIGKTSWIITWLIGLFLISGCVPLIVGSAVGALGGYAISRDTIQGETDIDYNKLWDVALSISRIRGTIISEDSIRGQINLEVESSKVYIRLVRLTRQTTRLRVSARKYHLPNLNLAQDIFVKIIEEAKR